MFQIYKVLSKAVLHFADFFLVMVSLMLKERFVQINQQILKKSHLYDLANWKTLREDYNRLACLTQVLNQNLSFLFLFCLGFHWFWVLRMFYFTLT